MHFIYQGNNALSVFHRLPAAFKNLMMMMMIVSVVIIVSVVVDDTVLPSLQSLIEESIFYVRYFFILQKLCSSNLLKYYELDLKFIFY